jgi:hypothetical protein
MTKIHAGRGALFYPALPGINACCAAGENRALRRGIE